MEQQTVTIAKAGIHTTLNARCSVLAAANPIYSDFDETLGLAKNINLPDSLLSRFDLVYVMRDVLTVDQDRKIANQVCRQARYCPHDGVGQNNEADEFHEPIFERAENENYEVAKLLSENVFEKRKFQSEGHEILSVDFLKKYLTVISKREVPRLSKEACHDIGAAYADLRQRVKNSPNRANELSVTTRTLESIIRLATAYAKLKMREEVTVEDVRWTRELIFQTRGYPTGEESDTRKRDLVTAGMVADSEDGSTKRMREDEEIDESRLEEFQIAVGEVYGRLREFVLDTQKLYEEVNQQKNFRTRPITETEYAKCIQMLIDQNKLFDDDGRLFLVA